MAARIENGRPQAYQDRVNLGCTLLLDVETVPIVASYDQLDERWKDLWDFKVKREAEASKVHPSELWFDQAGTKAEFAKIVTISVGKFESDAQGYHKTKIKSFYGHDERTILQDFSALLKEQFDHCGKHFLCAHNGYEFDYPLIARRMTMLDMPLPNLLNISGLRPWDSTWLLDTMDMWRFGDHKAYTRLELLAACLGIPSSKDDIKGSDVANVYYHEGEAGLERIKTYCEKDVVTLGKILLKFKRVAILESRDSNSEPLDEMLPQGPEPFE